MILQNPRLLALLPTAFHTQWVIRVGSRGRHSSVFSCLRQAQGQKAGSEVDVKSWPQRSSGSEPLRDTELKAAYQGEMVERRQLLSQVSCLSNVSRTLSAFIQLSPHLP